MILRMDVPFEDVLGQNPGQYFAEIQLRTIAMDSWASPVSYTHLAESTYYFILGLIPFMIFFVNAMLFFAAPQVDLITKAVHY